MAKTLAQQTRGGAPHGTSNGRARQQDDGQARLGIVPITVADEAPAEGATIEPLLITVEEAARLLSLGRSMVYELMNRGEIPSIHIGAARRIPLAGLRAWVAEQTEQHVL